MSTKTIPLLAGQEYQDLKTNGWTIEGWLAEWERVRQLGDYNQLYSLLHWGLQAFGEASDKARIFSFYMDIADGHSDHANFGSQGYQEWTIFGSIDRAHALQKLAEKAWQELCNRFFILGGESIPKDELTHRDLLLLNSDLSRKVVWFFSPRRYDYKSNRNLDHHPNNAYSQKTREFLRTFVYMAWDADVELRRRYGFSSVSDKERQLVRQTHEYYVSVRPELVEIMYEYGWLDFLKNRSLDLPTRRKLRELAMSTEFSSDKGKLQDLEDAYSMVDPEYGHRYVSRSRKSAEILLLYPLARLGRWRFLRADRLKHEAQDQERAARARARLQQQLAETEAELKSLSQ